MLRVSGTLRHFTRRYVAGKDVDSAMARALQINQSGFLVCIAYLKSAKSESEARTNLGIFQRVLDLAYLSDLHASVNVSLSQLGYGVDPNLGEHLLSQLVAHAVRRDALVWLDSDPFANVQSNLDVAIKINRIPTFLGHIGVALPANLFRTKADVDHAAAEKLQVRLHEHTSDIICPKNSSRIKGTFRLRDQYRRLSEALLASGLYCSFATRDLASIQEVLNVASAKNPPVTSFEFQFPDGVPIPHLLWSRQWRVRILVAFGPESPAYVTQCLLGW